MGKICFVCNYAPQYVAPSYILFDKHFDIKWFFGSNDTDIKEMDHALLKDVTVCKTVRFKRGYWIKGIGAVARMRDFSSYVLIGDPTCFSMWSLPYKIKLFNHRAKIYFWTHGWYGKESIVTSLAKKIFFHSSDGILLYGNYARELMIKKGFNEAKLHTIHNCLDHPAQVRLRNEIKNTSFYFNHFGNWYPVLLFVGRLTAVKKLDLLLNAVHLLRNKGENYNIVFVGDGPMREKLEEMSVELGLANNVWFYGACYDERINAQLIYNADLCVAPGNIGLTAMHVLVFGTPALTHNDFKWQMPEFEAIKEGVTGCFFERNNIDSLAQSISKWFVDRGDKRDEVRLLCYKEIDENWTPEYELNVLKQVLDE